VQGDVLAIRLPSEFSQAQADLAKQVARLIREDTGATAVVLVEDLGLEVVTGLQP
jgi:hypothetical protein